MLFAAALVSVAGCHWRHRNWRDNRNYSYNSYHDGDHSVRNQKASVMDRDS
jgi:hypothetical protein